MDNLTSSHSEELAASQFSSRYASPNIFYERVLGLDHSELDSPQNFATNAANALPSAGNSLLKENDTYSTTSPAATEPPGNPFEENFIEEQPRLNFPDQSEFADSDSLFPHSEPYHSDEASFPIEGSAAHQVFHHLNPASESDLFPRPHSVLDVGEGAIDHDDVMQDDLQSHPPMDESSHPLLDSPQEVILQTITNESSEHPSDSSMRMINDSIETSNVNDQSMDTMHNNISDLAGHSNTSPPPLLPMRRVSIKRRVSKSNSSGGSVRARKRLSSPADEFRETNLRRSNRTRQRRSHGSSNTGIEIVSNSDTSDDDMSDSSSSSSHSAGHFEERRQMRHRVTDGPTAPDLQLDWISSSPSESDNDSSIEVLGESRHSNRPVSVVDLTRESDEEMASLNAVNNSSNEMNVPSTSPVTINEFGRGSLLRSLIPEEHRMASEQSSSNLNENTNHNTNYSNNSSTSNDVHSTSSQPFSNSRFIIQNSLGAAGLGASADWNTDQEATSSSRSHSNRYCLHCQRHPMTADELNGEHDHEMFDFRSRYSCPLWRPHQTSSTCARAQRMIQASLDASRSGGSSRERRRALETRNPVSRNGDASSSTSGHLGQHYHHHHYYNPPSDFYSALPAYPVISVNPFCGESPVVATAAVAVAAPLDTAVPPPVSVAPVAAPVSAAAPSVQAYHHHHHYHSASPYRPVSYTVSRLPLQDQRLWVSQQRSAELNRRRMDPNFNPNTLRVVPSNRNPANQSLWGSLSNPPRIASNPIPIPGRNVDASQSSHHPIVVGRPNINNIDPPDHASAVLYSVIPNEEASSEGADRLPAPPLLPLQQPSMIPPPVEDHSLGEEPIRPRCNNSRYNNVG